MRFKRNDLCTLLAMHQTNLDKKAIDPIFSSILIENDETKLQIISTDTQRYLQSIISSELNNETTEFLINGTSLYDIIKKSKSEFFEIIEKDNNYTIIIDNAEFKISQHLKTESYKYKSQWQEEQENHLSIKSNILNESLKLIKWATSSDNARLVLNGICFDINNNELTLCATDTLKLAVIKLNCNSNIQGRWILGKKSIADLIHILEECEQQDIDLSFGKFFSLHYQKDQKEIIWKSLFLLGEYPPYQKVLQIQNQMNTQFEIEADEFKEIIDRIMIASNQNYPIITFNFNPENSTIASENMVLSGIDSLPISYKGAPIKISFNGRFLQEMISNISGIIKFSIKDPLSPIMIQSSTNENLIFIMAPVHISK